MLAAWFLQQRQPSPITPGDGAMVGLLAGVFGALVWAVLYVPIRAATGSLQQRMIERALDNASELPPALLPMLERAQHEGAGVLAFVVGFAFRLVLCAIFSTLGGLAGAMMVARRAPATTDAPHTPPLP